MRCWAMRWPLGSRQRAVRPFRCGLVLPAVSRMKHAHVLQAQPWAMRCSFGLQASPGPSLAVQSTVTGGRLAIM